MSKFQKLFTTNGETLTGQPWAVYPRPRLKRDSFLCLNGHWDFCACKEGAAPDYGQTIRVPFAPESILSEVDEVFTEDSVLWYRREFTLPDGFKKDRVLLHFGAADQCAAVYVNDVPVGEHIGGYDAFCFDITDALAEQNTLTVRITDKLSDCVLPYGKQSRKRGGMWYTPVSGIWQTVWIESVSDSYITDLLIDAGADFVTITALGADDGTVAVDTPSGQMTAPLKGGKARIEIPNPRMWCPDDPYLYNFTVTTTSDRVESYFALRTLQIQTVEGVPRLCLNGRPYFFHGLLDQGYYSDGLFTPATPDGFAEDIIAMKSLGFNMLRKHIKVEPEQFYYDCDRLGMIVFQDMVNNGKYSFIRDTALPTVGLLRLNDRLLHRYKDTRRQFETGMERTVAQLRNHPCICCWTIFNEGWGQFCGSRMYDKLRELDSTRFIDTASGWFSGVKSDVDSRHIYFRKARLKVGKKPLVLSEFGGYSWKPQGHVFNREETYGYRRYEDRDEFVSALKSLYTDEILPMVKAGLSAAVYTQVSDVEDETNGLLSYDRKIKKVLPEEFAAISQMLKE